MDWVVISSDDWKSHATPVIFVDALIAEMHERGFKGEIDRRLLVEYGLDRGGMCFVNRPLETFLFNGLVFTIPSEHVDYFYNALTELTPRKFGSRTYYKLHCYYSCIVLTPTLRRQLLRSLRRRVDRAEAVATAFYRSKRPLNELLAEANEKATGEKCPPEICGVDRHARFRKKAQA